MYDYFRESLNQVEPYIPGEQPQDIEAYTKINTNENPYPCSPVVEHAVRHFNAQRLRVYPDPVCRELRRQAARVYGIPAEQIFIGNGSDEILSLIMRIAVDPGDPVVYPYPTYVLYRTLTQIAGGKPVEIDLTSSFDLPEDFPAQAGKVTFLARPNSPTANLFDMARVLETIEEKRGLVVVDEAYADFSGSTLLDYVGEYSNLLVLRTLSKSYCLAGLRLGLAFGSPEVIEAFYRVKDSYNVNAFSQAVAKAALSDVGYMKETTARIISTRRQAVGALGDRRFRVYPTAANFLFAEHERFSGREIYEGLKDRRVLVRYFDAPRLDKGVRITIGTDEEMEKLYTALDEIL